MNNTLTDRQAGYPSIDRPWEKHYSASVLNFEFPKTTMYRCIYESNKNCQKRIAIEYFGRSFSYKDLFEKIDDTARALTAVGVRKSDIVTIAMPTTPETVYLLYAISKIGAIANMIDPRTNKEGIYDYTREAKSKLFVTIDVCWKKIKDITKETDVETVVIISAGDSMPTGIYCGYKVSELVELVSRKKERIIEDECHIKWNTFIQKKDEVADVDENTESGVPVAILHTGGTTGTPKGVMISNESFNTIAYQYKLSGMYLFPGQRFLDIMPPFIAYGVGAGLHMPFVVGMTAILIPKFEPKDFARMIIKMKPNHMAGVPSHWGNILESKEMKNADLSFLITPAVGGDGMNIKLEKKANVFLKQHRAPNSIIKGYGLTEQCSLATACINDINEIGSVGIPLPQNIISIFDPDTGEELQYNQRGEVCISGPTTMLGYFNNEKATNEIIRVHEDGRDWIHTGDIGYMSEDGMLFIDGRTKRMIIRNDGFKVFPFIIETAIKLHEDVDECIVVGVRDSKYSQGYLPMAHIVLKQQHDKSERLIKKEIFDLCREKLPEYAQPINLKFRKDLPYTSIGKVDFVALQEESEDKSISGR